MSDPHTSLRGPAGTRRAGPRGIVPLVIVVTAVGSLWAAGAAIYLVGGRLTFAPRSELLAQNGTFETVINAEGVVYFPRPYASPPNVVLAGPSENTVVTECARDHFRWKNTRSGQNERAAFGGTVNVFGSEGKVQWTATGVPERAP